MFKSMRRWFVKGTDPKTWPTRLEETFGGSRVINTDFTSFECHHRGVYAELVYFWMMHMTRRVFITRGHRRLLAKIILGRNANRFSRLSASLDQTLMSGLPWTSSANGFLNLTINAYLVVKSRHPTLTVDELVEKADGFKGVFEGDDGLYEFEDISPALIAALGVKLDLDVYSDYSRAGFCSIQVVRGQNSLCVDYRKVLGNFFELPRKYIGCSDVKAISLLRARALSYSHIAHDSPVVGALAYRMCELTKGLDISGVTGVLDDRKKEFVEKALRSRDYMSKPNVTDSMRLAYMDAFGVTPVEQLQLEAEIMEGTLDGFHLSLSHRWNAAELDVGRRFLSEAPGRVFITDTFNPAYRDVLIRGLNPNLAAVAGRAVVQANVQRWRQFVTANNEFARLEGV
jgi:hypothetical protein